MIPRLEEENDPSAGLFFRRRRALFYPKADSPGARLAVSCADMGQVPFFADDICRHHFGEPMLSTAELPEPGTYHRLFRITLSSGREVIARFSICPEDGPDHALLLDRWAEHTLRKEGLPCLSVYAVDLSRRLCPWDYELLEPARGVSLKHLDNNDDLLRPHLVRLGALLNRIHRITVPGYGLLAARAEGSAAQGSCDRWTDYLSNHLDRHLAVCRSIGAISAAETAMIHRLFDERLPELPTFSGMLLHGDVGNHNVFVADGAQPLLLDWEDALSGDPAYEVAFWATFHPERRYLAFFEGYFADAPASEEFMDRFWLYFLRIALAKTVVRHLLGLTDVPGRPAASQRIQRGLERCLRPLRSVACA
jgi:hypothetical protein